MSFKECFLERAQQTFVPMYRKVHEKYYNNTVFSLMKRPYVYCSFEEGVAEYYIPTLINPENMLQYHRIVIKTFEVLEEQKIRDEVKNLKKQIQKAPGIVDSETIILAARKTNVRKIIRGFRHNLMAKGRMTLIVVAEKPKAAWLRALSLIKKFWSLRAKKLGETLKVGCELLSALLTNDINSSSIKNSINKIIRSETLQNGFLNMVSTVVFLADMLKIAVLEVALEGGKG